MPENQKLHRSHLILNVTKGHYLGNRKWCLFVNVSLKTRAYKISNITPVKNRRYNLNAHKHSHTHMQTHCQPSSESKPRLPYASLIQTHHYITGLNAHKSGRVQLPSLHLVHVFVRVCPCVRLLVFACTSRRQVWQRKVNLVPWMIVELLSL